LREKNLATALKGVRGISKENLKYRNALLGIYKQCVDNVIKNKYPGFDSAKLVEDFEKLMDGYRGYCDDKGKTPPEAKGGWKKDTDIILDMNTTLSAVNPNRLSYLKEEYLAGNLRISDMKSDVRERTGKNGASKLSAEDVGAVCAYRDMLEQVVASRTGWWRFWHPFKNSEEKQALEALTAIVDMNTENAIAGDSIMGKSPIPGLQDELNVSAQKMVEKELEKTNAINNNRVKEDMGFLAENNNVKEISPKIEDIKPKSKENVIEV
jgi:hypothetical protein